MDPHAADLLQKGAAVLAGAAALGLSVLPHNTKAFKICKWLVITLGAIPGVSTIVR